MELTGPVKTGKKVTFTFPQKWYRKQLLIEAYIYDAEGKAPPGIIVKPILGVNKIGEISILNVEGKPQTQETQYGQNIIAKIITENMLGETLRLSLWERNTVTEEGHNPFGNLKLWEGKAKIINYNGIVEKKIMLSPSFPQLSKKPLYDGTKHEYYLLVEADNKTALETKPKVSSEIILSPNVPKPKVSPAVEKAKAEAERKRVRDLFGDATVMVTNSVGWDLIKVEGVSKAVVEMPEEKEKVEKECACKVYDLIWGNKVSCDFRKKVVEIAKDLNLPQEKNEGANWLMAVMALETGRSFSPKIGTFKKHKDDSKIGYVGLIQIGKDAATDLKVKRTDLLKLNGVEQLEYVEKFFKQDKFKDKLKTKTDLYLAVNYPNACGHGTEKDYVVYDSSKSAYDDNPMFKREDDESYIDKDGVKKYYKGKKGSSYVWEFEEAINQFYNEGKNHKTSVYSCLITGKPANDIKEIVTYYIYQAGSIEKNIPKNIKDDFKNKYQYIYIDSKYKTHDLGTFDYTITKEMNAGNVQGNNNVELLDARQFKGYSKEDVKLKFLTWNSDSERWYINPDCFAGLLGAMANENIDYLGFNGFSDDLAQSVGGSKSHRNGEKGDLRYLTTNKDGKATLLEDSDFDFTNQNKFNDSLYLFGWGRKEKMYSEYFKHGKNDKTLLNHTKHMKKTGKGGYRHHHHLHLSGFDHSLILINSK